MLTEKCMAFCFKCKRASAAKTILAIVYLVRVILAQLRLNAQRSPFLSKDDRLKRFIVLGLKTLHMLYRLQCQLNPLFYRHLQTSLPGGGEFVFTEFLMRGGQETV